MRFDIPDYRPTVFNLANPADDQTYNRLILSKLNIKIFDQFISQKFELVKIRNPERRLHQNEIEEIFYSEYKHKNITKEGRWVYYPWSDRMIHLLEESEFSELRTSRNKHKITEAEQKHLQTKSVGIIGLSVGSSVAVTMAIERVCGSLKLADFDTLELSNLNRIRSGLHNIGINKAIITAREIAELDPYLHVQCFTEGITDQNILEFLTSDPKLDLLVDECDDIGIKIKARQAAKNLGIPVVMETSDRGMLDIERFDLDRQRPLFHGMLAQYPEGILSNITPEMRLPLTLSIINATEASARGKASLIELGQSLSTWPQLASAVALGGGVVTDTCRKILLQQHHASGRFHVDLEKIIGYDPDQPTFAAPALTSVNDEWLNALLKKIELPHSQPNGLAETINVSEAVYYEFNCPVSKYVLKEDQLLLFANPALEEAFINYQNLVSDFLLGQSFDATLQMMRKAGLRPKAHINTGKFAKELKAYISFEPGQMANELENEVLENSTILENKVKSLISSDFHAITDIGEKTALATILGQLELMIQLIPHGHHDYFQRYMQWDDKEASSATTGVNFTKLPYPPPVKAALTLLRDPNVAEAIGSIGGGGLLSKFYTKNLSDNVAFAVFKLTENYFDDGRRYNSIMEKAQLINIKLHPLFTSTSIFTHLQFSEEISKNYIPFLHKYKEQLKSFSTFEERLSRILFIKLTELDKNWVSRITKSSEILFVDPPKVT